MERRQHDRSHHPGGGGRRRGQRLRALLLRHRGRDHGRHDEDQARGDHRNDDDDRRYRYPGRRQGGAGGELHGGEERAPDVAGRPEHPALLGQRRLDARGMARGHRGGTTGEHHRRRARWLGRGARRAPQQPAVGRGGLGVRDALGAVPHRDGDRGPERRRAAAAHQVPAARADAGQRRQVLRRGRQGAAPAAPRPRERVPEGHGVLQRFNNVEGLLG